MNPPPDLSSKSPSEIANDAMRFVRVLLRMFHLHADNSGLKFAGDDKIRHAQYQPGDRICLDFVRVADEDAHKFEKEVTLMQQEGRFSPSVALSIRPRKGERYLDDVTLDITGMLHPPEKLQALTHKLERRALNNHVADIAITGAGLGMISRPLVEGLLNVPVGEAHQTLGRMATVGGISLEAYEGRKKLQALDDEKGFTPYLFKKNVEDQLTAMMPERPRGVGRWGE